MKITSEKSTVVFNILSYIMLTLLAIICFLPFWLMIAGSFSSEKSVLRNGFKIIPSQFSLEAYKYVFRAPEQIIKAYSVSTLLVIVGTSVGLFLTSMAGYVLSRKDFRYRDRFAFTIYFTTLFGGGLIPWYILMVKYLHLKDSYLALLLPGLVSAWNIILMKNFMKSIPDSIIESAKIDGAGDFIIYLKLILPLSKPGLATLGLFMALGYWNDWFLANIFITTQSKFPLQYLLYKIIGNANFLRSSLAGQVNIANYQPPSETLKMATAIVVTGPIIFLYPFIQKYFVKGLTIGAVKG